MMRFNCPWNPTTRVLKRPLRRRIACSHGHPARRTADPAVYAFIAAVGETRSASAFLKQYEPRFGQHPLLHSRQAAAGLPSR